MTKTLLKLVGFSLLPASTLIISKFIGIIIVTNLLGIDWQVLSQQFKSNFFTVTLAVKDQNSQFLVSTYSNTIMISVMLMVIIFKIIQIKYLDEKSISPKNLTRLAENNLIGLVKKSSDLHLESILWFVFAWLAIIIILIDCFVANSSTIVLISAFILLSVLTVIYFRNIRVD